MALDLSSLETPRSRWVRLPDALEGEGLEVELKHRTMKERERFENKMTSHGILRKEGGVNPGRMSSLVAAFAEDVIIGWRGIPARWLNPDKPNHAYDKDDMARILNASPASLDLLLEAIKDEAAFFSQNGNGATG